jgi:hypothetical protein
VASHPPFLARLFAIVGCHSPLCWPCWGSL